MARIRIIDEWLRSPVSSPSRHRAVMVVAESWSEQRVLMRAFAASSDQTRPTIVLHGVELAIGPAGTDPHGEWGIHVEPPVDGRAQELRGQLELAARRLAGSKGNPPRLVDETSRFDNKATHLWAPGTPPDPGPGAAPPALSSTVHGFSYYEPAVVAPPSDSPVIPSAASRPTIVSGDPRFELTEAVPPALQAPTQPALRLTPVPHLPRRPSGSKTDQHWAASSTTQVGSRTQPGFMPPPAAPAPPPPASFSSLVGRTMPLGLQLSDLEREVLNALGRSPALTAREIGRIAGTDDPIRWMDRFLGKLGGIGLDLIALGDDLDGEPTYQLRR